MLTLAVVGMGLWPKMLRRTPSLLTLDSAPTASSAASSSAAAAAVSPAASSTSSLTFPTDATASGSLAGDGPLVLGRSFPVGKRYFRPVCLAAELDAADPDGFLVLLPDGDVLLYNLTLGAPVPLLSCRGNWDDHEVLAHGRWLITIVLDLEHRLSVRVGIMGAEGVGHVRSGFLKDFQPFIQLEVPQDGLVFPIGARYFAASHRSPSSPRRQSFGTAMPRGPVSRPATSGAGRTGSWSG